MHTQFSAYAERPYDNDQADLLARLFDQAADIVKLDEESFAQKQGLDPESLRGDLYAIDGLTYTDLQNYLKFHRPDLLADTSPAAWAYHHYRLLSQDLIGYYDNQTMLENYRIWLEQSNLVDIIYQDDSQAQVAHFLSQQLVALGIESQVTGPFDRETDWRKDRRLTRLKDADFVIVLDYLDPNHQLYKQIFDLQAAVDFAPLPMPLLPNWSRLVRHTDIKADPQPEALFGPEKAAFYSNQLAQAGAIHLVTALDHYRYLKGQGLMAD
ncbi:hypothetical protein AWM75_08055 [Aerococcus urinaehominis]|uniref:Uncharacterized protein n=2 Tax=Aerococcus urinaehominis TaxID=128944 RepID=A0A120IB24_9LACT|nr:hypothetical protein [Aerococcus urinaehominis]AMB99924.1 hypothetical protein AWM75_08055 [Aerococcus urinaehominis]SDM43271.1 hypothetical protein SAMN04487985_11628 [Aerococcus urinaehominis]